MYCKKNPKHKQRQGFHTIAGADLGDDYESCFECGNALSVNHMSHHLPLVSSLPSLSSSSSTLFTSMTSSSPPSSSLVAAASEAASRLAYSLFSTNVSKK